MPVFMVSYDLLARGQDYPRIQRRLDVLGGIRILYSVYLLVKAGKSPFMAESTAEQVGARAGNVATAPDS
jgi:hypothetical protein